MTSIAVVLFLFITMSFQACGKPQVVPNLQSPAENTSSSPLGPGGQWNLIFEDGFSGSQVDTTKWNLVWPFSPPLNNSLQSYVSSNVTVSSGSLHLTATNQASGGLPYSSGAVTTQNKFSFTYGAVEARLKVPAGKGFWPAIWMLYPTGPWPPEIDLIEVLGTNTSLGFMTFHYGTAQNMQSSHIPASQGVDFSSDFRIVTMVWEAGAITWYIDGVSQGVFSDSANVPSQPMVLLMNLGVGGAAGGFTPGTPDSSTPFPSEMTIDYVRVWQRK
ncbi:MAG: glycoside hydrolase family 16 protein [Bdellovibrionales bacterium]|nr:glycoside hydrolase family 16 protein [Bdellovibrionales bacterium]